MESLCIFQDMKEVSARPVNIRAMRTSSLVSHHCRLMHDPSFVQRGRNGRLTFPIDSRNACDFA